MGEDKHARRGQQPEAEASLEAAARSGSKKPDAQGYEARPETAPKGDSSQRKQSKAAKILAEGSERATKPGT